MGRATYPRIVDARYMAKWVKLRAQQPRQHANTWLCRACGGPATHSVFVQVDWFRGNDAGPFKACKEHKEAAELLLTPSAAQPSAS